MGGFLLDIPRTEEIKEEVEKELVPTAEEKAVIHDAVKEKADRIMDVDLDSLLEKREFVQVIETFGSDLIRRSASKNSILQKRVGEFGKAGRESGEVSKGIED